MLIFGLLRLARLRYLSLTVPPFVVGALGGPSPDYEYLWLGIGALILLRAVSSIGNCLADEVEDVIDHRERAELGEKVGHDRMGLTVLVCGALYLVLLAVMVSRLGIYWGAAVLWLVFLLVKVGYSFGPHLKRRRFSATFLLGGVSGGMFFLGWVGHGHYDLATGIGGAVLLWVMGASLCGSKDAPDVRGDAAVGYRSVYRDYIGNADIFRRVLEAVSRPYVAVIALAVLTEVIGGPGWRLLWCLLVYPLGILFARLYARADTDFARSLVREVGYLYWIVFMGVALICLVPLPETAGVVAGGLVWYLLVSALAHPDPVPFGFNSLRTWDGFGLR